MAKTLEQLLSLSTIIANETKAGANTALRVGGLFSDIIYYLRDLDYADKEDIPSLEGYATEQWVLGKGYLTEHQDLSAYAKKTDIPTIPTKVSAFENDANYATTSDLDSRIDALVNGAPQAYDTLKEIADVLANNINSIDDILTALGTKVSKDDFNTAIANVNTAIDSLNTELGLKLDAATFNELFEKVQLENGTWAIKAKLGLFSDGFISAKGSNVGGTSSEGGAVALYQLNDVLANGTSVSGAVDGAVFVYDGKLGKWKGIAQSAIVPNLTGYATESWVLQQGFLTQHQDLSDYAKLTDIPTIPTTDINKGVTAYGWGNHASAGYQPLITSTNKLAYSLISGVPTKLSQFTNDLGLGTFAYKSSLAFADLTGKPTTLSGYGITDAYTKSQVDSALGGYLPLSGGTITGNLTVGNSTGVLGIKHTSSNSLAYLIYQGDTNWRITDNGWGMSYGIIHSGNIGSQSVARAKILVTDSGSSMVYTTDSTFYIGDNIYTTKSTQILGNDVRLRYGASASVGLILNSSGNVGIGTTSPQYKLDVNGTLHANNTVTFDSALKVGGIASIGAAQGQYDANRAQLSVISTANMPAMLWLGSSGEKKWSVESRGEADSYRFSLYSWVAAKHILKIEHSGVATLDGTFNATIGIYSDGYVSAKGQNTSSDMRLKNVLNDVVLNVSDIANAPSIRFAWKNGGGIDVGSSAQYWQRVLPDAVKERDELEMQYGNIALLSAIAIARNMGTMEEDMETMKQELANLKRENIELKNRIDMLERGIA